ncbi:MAG: transketolase [Deltaproteobacteria bacterium]|nr:transketolase [Deltaproteobacteria bacterium]
MEKNRPKTQSPQIDQLAVNTIRFLAVDAIEKASSGHPGMPLGAAPIIYALWSRFLKYNPANPNWLDRDRFVLSAGHASALFYAMLHLSGYDLAIDELKNFRQWGSKTPGHPEKGMTPGVETTTGPLGQGLGNGVGMAIAEAHLGKRFNRPGFDLVDHYTYVLASDGDLMEGVAMEAASLAGHLGLGKLVCFYDSNNISLSGPTSLCFTEDTGKKYAAMGWHILEVMDANDLTALENALDMARKETNQPTLIICHSHIGFGSPKFQDRHDAHGSPLGAEEVCATKKALGWLAEEDFYTPGEITAFFAELKAFNSQANNDWDEILENYGKKFPELKKEWDLFHNNCPASDWQKDLPVYSDYNKSVATRSAAGQILNGLAARCGSLIGGSADLDPSTKTVMKNQGFFQNPLMASDNSVVPANEVFDYGGRNLSFGVREHGMGSIMNGIAAHGGLTTYGSTFLVFSDYMRPAIRLAALMELPTIYIFTHDSVAVGEDGPTHQPIEHTMALRSIPGLVVIRPADANETLEGYKYAVSNGRRGPVAFILTRQNVPVIDREKYASAEGLNKGGYILADAGEGSPDIILIATGSEVHLALEARNCLEDDGVATRVVSMPSWELFEAQSAAYRESVLPVHICKRLAIEAGITMGWEKYVGSGGKIIGIDRFGASAPGGTNLKKFGFTADNVLSQARALLD